MILENRFFRAAALLTLTFSSAQAADPTADTHFWKNESEAGVIMTSGNTSTQTYNFKQLSLYNWDSDLIRFTGHYLKTTNSSVETAKNWSLGLRYERALADQFSLFLGQTVESNRFAGFNQRYNTDVGGKYFLVKRENLIWSTEGGYRYTVENRSTGQVRQHYLRAYSDVYREWTKTFSSKLWVEYLPNISVGKDFQLNTEASIAASLSEIFAIKVGYLVRYRNILIPPATERTDTQFTTALVAKF